MAEGERGGRISHIRGKLDAATQRPLASAWMKGLKPVYDTAPTPRALPQREARWQLPEVDNIPRAKAFSGRGTDRGLGMRSRKRWLC